MSLRGTKLLALQFPAVDFNCTARLLLPTSRDRNDITVEEKPQPTPCHCEARSSLSLQRTSSVFKQDARLLLPTSRDRNDITVERKTKPAKNYIEHLKGYFDFGLSISRGSMHPLEYGFEKYLSANEADEFYSLMESLPKNETIILDFTNSNGFDPIFNSGFQRLIQKNPNVYWLVKDGFQKEIQEIGVNPNKVFKDYEKLMNRIEYSG